MQERDTDSSNVTMEKKSSYIGPLSQWKHLLMREMQWNLKLKHQIEDHKQKT